jgi:uncharacterized RDD family membrane protein YckC
MADSESEQAGTMATEPTNGRNVVVGLAVTVSRAGATAGRSMLRPVRFVESLPFVRGRVDELAATGREAELDSRRRLEGVAESLLASPETERALDHVLAGPLPVSVGRSLMEHQVVERVARETLDERQTTRMVETILASPEFEAALHRVLSSPALRDALTQQTSSYADQVVANLRQRTHRADGAAERRPRAWTHREARTMPAPNGGLVSRGIAFAIDLVLVSVIFVIGSALVGLASSAVGGFHPEWLAVALAGVSAVLLEIVYFAGFWSLAGQTPGMRLLGLRVLGPSGAQLGFGRALLRLVGTWLAMVPFFLGFLPIVIDERRRGLQDFIAGTVVTYDGADVMVAPASVVSDAVPTASH